jgi:hypothetical protein
MGLLGWLLADNDNARRSDDQQCQEETENDTQKHPDTYTKGAGMNFRQTKRAANWATRNYTRGVLTVIAAAMCVIAYKLCVPTSPFITWGDLQKAGLSGRSDDALKKIPVIRIQGGRIDTDTDVSGSISIDR